jgi:hypothetical protein
MNTFQTRAIHSGGTILGQIKNIYFAGEDEGLHDVPVLSKGDLLSTDKL